MVFNTGIVKMLRRPCPTVPLVIIALKILETVTHCDAPNDRDFFGAVGNVVRVGKKPRAATLTKSTRGTVWPAVKLPVATRARRLRRRALRMVY
jgi:hypothetical protein